MQIAFFYIQNKMDTIFPSLRRLPNSISLYFNPTNRQLPVMLLVSFLTALGTEYQLLPCPFLFSLQGCGVRFGKNFCGVGVGKNVVTPTLTSI
jgi:hypothetical protein